MVTTTGSFTCSGNVMFQAGTQITLNPGFQTATGSTFSASIVRPDFQIGISPASGTAQPGVAATYTVTVAGIFNFGGSVALTYSGPTGTSGTFSAQTVTVPTNGLAPVTTLTVSDTSASAGTYPITVTATAGTASHAASSNLTIPAGDFTISLTPVRSSTDMTAPATYTVTLLGTNGFSGAVTLQTFGLPTGIGTPTFSPAATVMVNSNPPPTLTIPIGSALGGVASFFVQGRSGNLSHNSSPTSLTINPPSFSISPSGTIPVSIVAGQSATVQLNLVPMYGAPGPIQVQYIGLNNVTLSTQPTNNIILGSASQPVPVSVTLNANANATSGSSEVIFTSQLGYGSQVAAFQTTVTGTAISASCTASVNPAKANQLVTFTVTPSGGSGPYTYAWTGATGSGSTATQTYPNAGSYSPVVVVKDSNQSTTQASCMVTVVGPPTISIPNLPVGTVSTSYFEALNVSSGAPPNQIALTTASMLPPGLMISNSAPVAITGTPTISGTYSFTLTVTDQLGQTGTSPPSSLTINPKGALSISPTSLASGTVGSMYSSPQLTASGGTAPYSWALSGNFPSSLVISPTSTTTALLTSSAFVSATSYSFTVTATDSLNAAGSQAYTLTVNNPSAPAITPTSLPGMDLGTFYSQTVTASGGTGTYSNWQLGGNVPPGLTIPPSGDNPASGGNQATIGGTLTGAPNTTYSFTVSVTSGTVGTQSYTIMVTQPYKEYIRLGGRVIAIENH